MGQNLQTIVYRIPADAVVVMPAVHHHESAHDHHESVHECVANRYSDKGQQAEGRLDGAWA